MGFFGDMLKDAFNSMMDSCNDMKVKKEQYMSLSDDQLVNLARRSGPVSQRTAAFSVLKDRYGEYRAKEMIGMHN